jgi:hypothetical protein
MIYALPWYEIDVPNHSPGYVNFYQSKLINVPGFLELRIWTRSNAEGTNQMQGSGFLARAKSDHKYSELFKNVVVPKHIIVNAQIFTWVKEELKSWGIMMVSKKMSVLV